MKLECEDEWNVVKDIILCDNDPASSPPYKAIRRVSWLTQTIRKNSQISLKFHLTNLCGSCPSYRKSSTLSSCSLYTGLLNFKSGHFILHVLSRSVLLSVLRRSLKYHSSGDLYWSGWIPLGICFFQSAHTDLACLDMSLNPWVSAISQLGL